jgi:hypothetical protein
MKPRRPVMLAGVVAGICGALAGCQGKAEYATIGRADRLTLFEGLPHQYYEKDALEKEMRTKETVQLHGFPFYRETLDLKEGDSRRLKDLLGNPSSYEPYSGEKKCGGFHPDYAVEWSFEGRAYHCLICFGCYEFRVYGPQGEQFYDIRAGAYEGLETLLKPFRKNRPPHETYGP